MRMSRYSQPRWEREYSPDTSTDICPKADGAASHTDESSFATRATTATHETVAWIQREANNMIPRLTAHDCVRQTRLAKRDGSERFGFPDELTVDLFLLAGSLDAFERANPADIAHRCLHALDVELVFKADGQPMERTRRTIACNKSGIELLRMLNRLVKEDFMQAIRLPSNILAKSPTYARGLHRPVDGPGLLDGRRPSPLLWRSTCQWWYVR